MSERDLRRIGVLSEVISERRTIVSAATVLAVSVRHVHRLLQRLEAGGGAGLAHKARGRPPNNGIDAAIRDYAIALITEKYADFGPTLAAEMLVRHHALTVSRETLRKWPT
jgi:molybdenum-dependent DNA-binding transcriptional regulator ModE